MSQISQALILTAEDQTLLFDLQSQLGQSKCRTPCQKINIMYQMVPAGECSKQMDEETDQWMLPNLLSPCFVDDKKLIYLRGFAPNKLLILPTARIQNKCVCRLTLMNSL